MMPQWRKDPKSVITVVMVGEINCLNLTLINSIMSTQFHPPAVKNILIMSIRTKTIKLKQN